VHKDPLEATACALGYLGLAGEFASQKTSLPGSYAIFLIDALNQITPEILAEGLKVEV
jgi:hydroxyethylthiazole kinase-like sugar kinase family protein